MVEEAREHVAALVGAAPREVVFTSGTTESNALALHGARRALGDAPLLLTAASHASTVALAESWRDSGHDVRFLSVDATARIDVAALAADAPSSPCIATAPLVEPVTGNVQPVMQFAAALPDGSALHVDAAQAAGRVDMAPLLRPAAFVSLSAHKLGALAGTGALIVRDGAPFAAPGGHVAQERGRRGGTEAAALLAAFGAAAEAVHAARALTETRWRAALAPFLEFVRTTTGGEVITTQPCAAGIVAVRFEGCRGDVVLAALDQVGVRVSAGTACASGARTPPAVLLAAGRDATCVAEVLRVSLGETTTTRNVFALVDALRVIVPRVRAVGTRQEKS